MLHLHSASGGVTADPASGGVPSDSAHRGVLVLRRVLGAVLAVVAAVSAGVVAIALAPPAQAATATFPIPVNPGSAKQLVTVEGSPGSTDAVVRTYELRPTGWAEKFPGMPAKVGAAGLTTDARDSFPGTPIGTFPMTQTFGRQADPGTKMPYFKTDPYDWWSGDKDSSTYNYRVRCAVGSCPMREDRSEHLLPIGAVYDYVAVMNYNRPAPRYGKGAAFFLHVTDGRPTAGCVAIARASMQQILRWLDPAKQPVISVNYRKPTPYTYNLPPVGVFSAAIPAEKAIRVSGWAADLDRPTTPVSVDVYVDGRMAARLRADQPNPAGGSAYPQVGGKHGYAANVPVSPGYHQVCVTALNIGPAGLNTRLGCTGAPRAPLAQWYLRAPPYTQTGVSFAAFAAPVTGPAQWLACDFDGSGRDRPTRFGAGRFETAASSSSGAGVSARAFGQAGDVGVCGDWNGDGVDSPGVRRGSSFYLTDNPAGGSASRVILFGNPGDRPVVGDWAGSGRDSLGLWRPATRTAYLRPVATSTATRGVAWPAPVGFLVAGDWNGDGVDTLGTVTGNRWSLADTAYSATANRVFLFGVPAQVPLTGNFGPAPGSDLAVVQ